MEKLSIEGLPYSELLRVKGTTAYPVLISQAVKGKVVKDIWHDDAQFQHLDPHHTALQILSAILLNPEDGKEDNFILSSDLKRLIPIDNDHALMWER